MTEDTFAIAQAKNLFNGGQGSNEKWRAQVGKSATTKSDLAGVEGGLNRFGRTREGKRQSIFGNRE
jgi:hypothetical protein